MSDANSDIQVAIGHFLDAEFYGLAGAYSDARGKLEQARAHLAGLPVASEPRGALLDVIRASEVLNERLLEERFRAASPHRHPVYRQSLLATSREGSFEPVHDFYSVACKALGTNDGDFSLLNIRNAILSDVPDDDPELMKKIVSARGHRYRVRLDRARETLPLRREETEPSFNDTQALADAGLDGNGGFTAFVIRSLTQAQIDRYNVEHERSVCVGALLSRSPRTLETDETNLERSAALLTFTYASCMALPWAFSCDPKERAEIQRGPKTAYVELKHTAVWLARQVILLSIYRRAQAHRLMGDHERSYNDLRKVQRISRRTRHGLPDDGAADGRRQALNTLEALAEFRIGELYRADYDAAQGLVHLCRSHDLLTSPQEPGLVGADSLAEVHICLAKAKAFFEVGMFKRALKWFVRAWLSLRGGAGPNHPPPKLTRLENYLKGQKHAPEADKKTLGDRVSEAIQELVAPQPQTNGRYDALIADILNRVAHVLLVLRLEENGKPSFASQIFRHAADLDPLNLLTWTGLLRCRLRGVKLSSRTRSPPEPMSCWPSGATEVDQLIRVGEYLMLKRLCDTPAGASPGSEVRVARSLLEHFHTHTDSINLRVSIHDRYLMQGQQARHQRRERIDTGNTPPDSVEFICLRRYGSFHPLMPRPAAVSAVGGGYCVRILSGDLSLFNILIDPGHGAVYNLYRAGLSIADVDMIIVTHDHPDHLANLDAIISLRHEFHAREAVLSKGSLHAPDQERMLILGNDSVMGRYSTLNGKGEYLVMHIADAAAQRCPQLTRYGIEITALPTKHHDIGRLEASGFMLALESLDARVTFMSDTAVGCLDEYDHVKPAPLHSHIVVAHISDVPTGELRDLARLSAGGATSPSRFEKALAELLESREEDAIALMQALSLVDYRKPSTPFPLFDADFVQMMKDQGWEHLFLNGLLQVAGRLADVDDGTKRVLIVGELREQLGSFRGTIAREVNRHVFGREPGGGEVPARQSQPDQRPVAVTADIGLRIRLDGDGARVYCSTCALDNDHLLRERFHEPEDIREVCVKGDHEAIYWNCRRHDPSRRSFPAFVEQMSRYDPLAAGGRYHG